MKFFIFSLWIFSLFNPVFSEGERKYKKEDFEKIKTMKVEYLKEKLECVNNSQNFKQLKKCWRDKK